MDGVYHLCTERSLCACASQSSVQSDYVHLWCRLLFQEEEHRSENVLRLKKQQKQNTKKTCLQVKKEELDSNINLARLNETHRVNVWVCIVSPQLISMPVQQSDRAGLYE